MSDTSAPFIVLVGALVLVFVLVAVILVCVVVAVTDDEVGRCCWVVFAVDVTIAAIIAVALAVVLMRIGVQVAVVNLLLLPSSF